jgi:nucleoid-associated protein YgaU
MQTVVAAGGNLFEIACEYLNDATQWNRIATLNQIDDPWLAGLTTLIIPAPLAPPGGTDSGL